MTQNATWCQNRGCICISSTRRTYGRIHMLPVIQTRTIILCTELFPKKRREKIFKVFNLSSSTEYYKNYKIPSNTVYSTVFPHAIQQLQVILHTELILLQEILQLQGSSRVIPCRLLPATVPRVSKHSTRQNKAPGSPTAFQGHTAQAGFQ